MHSTMEPFDHEQNRYLLIGHTPMLMFLKMIYRILVIQLSEHTVTLLVPPSLTCYLSKKFSVLVSLICFHTFSSYILYKMLASPTTYTRDCLLILCGGYKDRRIVPHQHGKKKMEFHQKLHHLLLMFGFFHKISFARCMFPGFI